MIPLLLTLDEAQPDLPDKVDIGVTFADDPIGLTIDAGGAIEVTTP